MAFGVCCRNFPKCRFLHHCTKFSSSSFIHAKHSQKNENCCWSVKRVLRVEMKSAATTTKAERIITSSPPSPDALSTTCHFPFFHISSLFHWKWDFPDDCYTHADVYFHSIKLENECFCQHYHSRRLFWCRSIYNFVHFIRKLNFLRKFCAKC